MKTFKILLSIVLVCALMPGIGVIAHASSSSYSIDIPEGFTESSASEQDAVWKNADGSVIISLAVTENTSNVKVNPNDAGQSYFSLLENKMKASLVGDDISGEVVSISSSLMELGEHDAIRVFMQAKYTFQNGSMDVYQVCYLFETQNYFHSFVVFGDENISELGDELIKTVQINDEAIPLQSDKAEGGISVIGWTLIGAGVGTLVGVALALINKLSKKKSGGSAAEPTKAPTYSPEQADEPEATEAE